ncbi:MAG: hypothetical protein AAFR59_04690 [Bacteroidota bacterium]
MMQCTCCKRVYLGFGVISLKMYIEEVHAFTNELERQLNQWRDHIDPLEKSFFFATSSSDVKIVLCYEEMDVWYRMLANGLLLLEVEEVMVNEEWEDDE